MSLDYLIVGFLQRSLLLLFLALYTVEIITIFFSSKNCLYVRLHCLNDGREPTKKDWK